MISRNRISVVIFAFIVAHAALWTNATAQDAKMAYVEADPFEPVRVALDNEERRATLTEEDWKTFGDHLTEGLESENEGIRLSALRLAAYYGDKLQMGRRATIDAVRMYRDDPDPHVRRMAVVAIARINHPWGIDFLTRSIEFEDSTDIEQTIRHALQEQEMTAKE